MKGNHWGRKLHIPCFKLGMLALIFKKLPFKTDSNTLIHTHFGTSGLLAIILGKRLNLPLITSFYGHDFSSFPKKYYGLGKIVLRLVFRYSSKCIAMTSQMAEELIELGCPATKIEIMLPGCFPLDSCISKINKIYHITMICSFREKKNHILVLNAMSLLKNSENCPRLTLAGDGPLLESMKRKCTELQLDSLVSFYGRYQSKNELKKLLLDSQLFLHPSKTAENGDSEGFPTAILEAMSAAVPVITTRHAGMNTLNEKHVFFCKEDSPEELASLISQCVKNPATAEKIGRNGHNFFLSNASSNITEQKRFLIYQEVLASQNRH
jgi:glycosyltransferase involved in cell wall biosynthesis